MQDPIQAPVSSDPQTPAPRGMRKRWLALLVVIGAVAGTALAFVPQAIEWWRHDDMAPLERPWINAPFITTPMDVVDQMLEAAEVQEGEMLYDLGCGDGRIAIVAAEKYGCRSKGFDIDPDRIRDSRANAKNRGVEDRVTFEQKDVLTLDLSEADVVALYLLPRYVEKLLPAFENLRPGARIVSHDFHVEGWTADREIRYTSAEDNQLHRIFVWIAPITPPRETEP